MFGKQFLFSLMLFVGASSYMPYMISAQTEATCTKTKKENTQGEAHSTTEKIKEVPSLGALCCGVVLAAAFLAVLIVLRYDSENQKKKKEDTDSSVLAGNDAQRANATFGSSTNK